jgi:hypothetical protein
LLLSPLVFRFTSLLFFCPSLSPPSPTVVTATTTVDDATRRWLLALQHPPLVRLDLRFDAPRKGEAAWVAWVDTAACISLLSRSILVCSFWGAKSAAKNRSPPFLFSILNTQQHCQPRVRCHLPCGVSESARRNAADQEYTLASPRRIRSLRAILSLVVNRHPNNHYGGTTIQRLQAQPKRCRRSQEGGVQARLGRGAAAEAGAHAARADGSLSPRHTA